VYALAFLGGYAPGVLASWQPQGTLETEMIEHARRESALAMERDFARWRSGWHNPAAEAPAAPRLAWSTQWCPLNRRTGIADAGAMTTGAG